LHKRRRLARFIYPAAAAVVLLVTVGIISFRLNDRTIYEYVNNGDVAMNIGLPDGTQVWINPGTHLVLDKHFNERQRDVRLCGEAYFDVARDGDRPFVVSTDGFKVKVLGTVFNVKSVPGERMSEVTLAQGSIMMQNGDGVNMVRLSPGQKAVLDAENSALDISSVAVGDMLMRHYGAVSMRHATISDIVERIGQVYGVKINVLQPADTSTYNFSFQKDNDIEDVLSMLRFVCKGQEFSLCY
ncbi:MAG: FecR family protein, partial [Candidatus Cryptobacteroides sp.]